MKLTLTVFAATLVSLVAVAAPASAHIRFDPAEAVVGRQTYSIRVPNEREASTIGVSLEVPADVEVSGILPVAGWQYAVEREPVPEGTPDDGHGDAAASTRITGVTWTGGEIKQGEYALFGVSTNYAGDPGDLVWKAFQTYAGGEVVAWDDSSAEKPAPKVSVAAESEIDRLTNTVNGLQTRLDQQGGGNQTAALWVSVIALVMATAGLLVLGKRTLAKRRS